MSYLIFSYSIMATILLQFLLVNLCIDESFWSCFTKVPDPSSKYFFQVVNWGEAASFWEIGNCTITDATSLCKVTQHPSIEKAFVVFWCLFLCCVTFYCRFVWLFSFFAVVVFVAYETRLFCDAACRKKRIEKWLKLEIFLKDIVDTTAADYNDAKRTSSIDDMKNGSKALANKQLCRPRRLYSSATDQVYGEPRIR